MEQLIGIPLQTLQSFLVCVKSEKLVDSPQLPGRVLDQSLVVDDQDVCAHGDPVEGLISPVDGLHLHELVKLGSGQEGLPLPVEDVLPPGEQTGERVAQKKDCTA